MATNPMSSKESVMTSKQIRDCLFAIYLVCIFGAGTLFGALTVLCEFGL